VSNQLDLTGENAKIDLMPYVSDLHLFCFEQLGLDYSKYVSPIFDTDGILAISSITIGIRKKN
jgi:hypothetical protein